MFGSLGGAELILVLVLALLLFGPRKMPQIGKTLGRGLSEFRRATNDFKMNLEREVDLQQVNDAGRELKNAVADAKNLGIPRGALSEPPEPESHDARGAESSSPAQDPAPSPDGGKNRDS